MARNTSLAAFREIQANGLLSKRRLEVYVALFYHGPLTRNELDRLLAPTRSNPAFSRRLTELELLGVVARVGQRECGETGFMCDTWDVTPNLPQWVGRGKVPAWRTVAKATRVVLEWEIQRLVATGNTGVADELSEKLRQAWCGR